MQKTWVVFLKGIKETGKNTCDLAIRNRTAGHGWRAPVIPGFGRLRQECGKLEASLLFIVRLSQKQSKAKQTGLECEASAEPN